MIINVCANNKCVKSGKIEVTAGSLVMINLVPTNSRHRITRLSFGTEVVDITSNKLVLADSFLSPMIPKTNDKNVLYQRYYDRKAVANMTADFWWVRQKIWF